MYIWIVIFKVECDNSELMNEMLLVISIIRWIL